MKDMEGLIVVGGEGSFRGLGSGNWGAGNCISTPLIMIFLY